MFLLFFPRIFFYFSQQLLSSPFSTVLRLSLYIRSWIFSAKWKTVGPKKKTILCFGFLSTFFSFASYLLFDFFSFLLNTHSGKTDRESKKKTKKTGQKPHPFSLKYIRNVQSSSEWVVSAELQILRRLWLFSVNFSTNVILLLLFLLHLFSLCSSCVCESSGEEGGGQHANTQLYFILIALAWLSLRIKNCFFQLHRISLYAAKFIYENGL